MARISDELNLVAQLLLKAGERSEVLALARQLNDIVIRVMEREEHVGKGRKALSATIKFTDEEIKGMSKSFKKEFIANGCVAHIIKRPSGKDGFFYEIRYRRNGYNITVSNKDLMIAKKLFTERTKKLEEPVKVKGITFGEMTDEWLMYKNGKISPFTWRQYKMRAEKYFTDEMRGKNIKGIRTAELDAFMEQFSNRPRLYEDMRILLNSVFKYALLNAVISHNPVSLLPSKRAERISRRSLTDGEIRAFLKEIKKPRFDKVRQTAYALYFFGVRLCETETDAKIEDGFLVCRNRKRKDGKNRV